MKESNPVYKIVIFTEAKQHGDISLIAKETGYSTAMVSHTLKGLRNNPAIVDAAYRLVQGRQTNLQRLQAFL